MTGTSSPPTINRVGAATSGRYRSARSGRPPRDTTAPIDAGSRAAACSTAPAPVLAPKIADGQCPGSRFSGQPGLRRQQTIRQERHVEDFAPIVGFRLLKKIKEQRDKSACLQPASHKIVAGTQPSAPAAVRKEHDSGRL